jgi:hypothetical protein
MAVGRTVLLDTHLEWRFDKPAVVAHLQTLIVKVSNQRQAFTYSRRSAAASTKTDRRCETPTRGRREWSTARTHAALSSSKAVTSTVLRRKEYFVSSKSPFSLQSSAATVATVASVGCPYVATVASVMLQVKRRVVRSAYSSGKGVPDTNQPKSLGISSTRSPSTCCYTIITFLSHSS